MSASRPHRPELGSLTPRQLVTLYRQFLRLGLPEVSSDVARHLRDRGYDSLAYALKWEEDARRQTHVGGDIADVLLRIAADPDRWDRLRKVHEIATGTVGRLLDVHEPRA